MNTWVLIAVGGVLIWWGSTKPGGFDMFFKGFTPDRERQIEIAQAGGGKYPADYYVPSEYAIEQMRETGFWHL